MADKALPLFPQVVVVNWVEMKRKRGVVDKVVWVTCLSRQSSLHTSSSLQMCFSFIKVLMDSKLELCLCHKKFF